MKIIEYFIDNRQLNHVLMAFFVFLGVFSWINIPKEFFPDFAFDKIAINGAYAGSSADNLDKMIIKDLETNITGLSHIHKAETIITSGSFNMLLSLDGGDKQEILSKVKDEISKLRQNLPSDMNEPTAKLLDRTIELARISVSSNTKSYDEIVKQAREIKTEISKLSNVSNVNIFGESDEEIEIKLDTDAIRAYGLNHIDVANAVKNISYTFPLGQIEQDGSFVFVSTANGKQTIDGWLDTIIKVGGKSIYLKEIATIKKYRPQDAIISSFNNEKNVSITVMKDTKGNSIKIKAELDKLIEKLSPRYPELKLILYADTSKVVNDRLSTIISNLTMGLILIFITMSYLVNFRSAIIVTLGVPFAFLIGVIFLYYVGESINIISLIGALLVMGMAVDDAIVVNENIQRHIDEGYEPREAAILGTKEVAFPIILASTTTIAAFSPIFMMSGETMKFMALIPVVVVVVLLGSLLESFVFLPLHSTELLKKGTPSKDWSKPNEIYSKILHRLIKYKKTALAMFFIGVPLITVASISMLNFQFFLKFDADSMSIGGKFPISTTIETTYDVTTQITKDLLAKKDELFIKNISTVAGNRRDLMGNSENGSHVFTILIDLQTRKPENILNAYINPILDFSFNFNDPKKVRELAAETIKIEVEKIVQSYTTKSNLQEFNVQIAGPGLIRNDIQLNLIGKDDKQLNNAIEYIKKGLTKIKGIKDIGDNIGIGKSEYKLSINNYGEHLGLSEAVVASAVSKYFLANRASTTYGDDGVINITTEDINKDDLNTLKEFEIPTPDGKYVKLMEIVDITIINDYERVNKEDGFVIKSVFANVDKDIITPSEAIKELTPAIEELKKSGIEIKFGGEQEKNEELKNDMILALGVAIFLILIQLLLIFPRLKYALMILSVIPLSLFGAFLGHLILDINLTMPSVIGMLGLAGVVVNDGIVMLEFLHETTDTEQFYKRATQRLRPIFLTTFTTFVGFVTLIFFPTGQAVMMMPIAVSLGFGLLWGTVMNLLYLPTLYAVINKIKP